MDNWEIPAEALEFLQKISARGFVLLTSAYLEAALADLLCAHFVQHACAEELLEGQGGLAGFSSQIDAAFLLGLISLDERRDLHMIRRIRNEFAHSPDPTMSLDNPTVKDRFMALKEYPPISKEAHVNPLAVQRFHRACGFLLYTLTLREERTEHRLSPSSVTEQEIRKRLEEARSRE